jgi:hypothetical protein
LGNEQFFPEENSGNTCSVRGGFTSNFVFVDNESYDEATYGSERLYKLRDILDHLNAKFRGVVCQ